ncbi:MAG: hypothetical protein ACOYI3_04410 [Christensenellales bacterium]|jgi:DNA-binding NarL/FixJ family response regulator
MRIAVCDGCSATAEQLCGWIKQYCALYQLPLIINSFASPELFAACDSAFDIAFLGFGGGAGFLAARALRERDSRCRIILIDDTPEYAIRSVRIHCAAFLLRPVQFRDVVKGMQLAIGGGGP